MLKRVVVACVLAILALSVRPAAAEQVIFVVRHAEKAPTPSGQPPSRGMMADDPPLSPAGEQRAARLAAILAQSGIRQIYTTEYKRTRQTAAPLAEKLKIKPVMAAAKDLAPLVAQLEKATAPVLVVGHGNTVPAVIKALGVAEPVTLGDEEYDDIFIVVRSVSGKGTLIRLKY